jgi:HD-GYP domain-containing protein (c-di-GMP phosphodiesterase class II)
MFLHLIFIWGENVKKQVDQVIEGTVLQEDIMGMTQYPIVKKGTVITKELIRVLIEFNIQTVEIENVPATPALLNNEKKEPKLQTKTDTIKNDSEFRDLYNNAIRQYKSHFIQWQSGAPLKIESIREYLYPIIEFLEKDDSILPNLHTFSNKQEYIYHHAISVGILSGMLAKKMGYTKGQYLQSALAGCVANAGMARISPRLINKTADLTEEDLKEIRNHPISSLKMVQTSPLLKAEGKLGIFQHHERLDGSGYPLGEKGKRIHTNAMIIAISDVYHALTTERPYRKKRAVFQALDVIRVDHFGQFDIGVINALFALIADLPIGTKVRLSNGIVGELLFKKPSALTRPLIKVLLSSEIIDLEKDRSIYISEILD